MWGENANLIGACSSAFGHLVPFAMTSAEFIFCILSRPAVAFHHACSNSFEIFFIKLIYGFCSGTRPRQAEVGHIVLGSWQ